MEHYPEYHKNEKFIDYNIIKMRPSLYGILCKHGFNGMDGGDFRAQDNLVWEYALRTVDGSPMPMPYLEYELTQSRRKGEFTSFSQEGRHRAEAATMLGIAEIPVMIVTMLDPVLDNRSPERLKQFTTEILRKVQ